MSSDFDPCAEYRKLEKAYIEYLSGSATSVVEFEVGGGTRRRVEFHKANPAYIEKMLNELRAQCQQASGIPFRRVIIGG